jgi:UDPglucose--hexose-1-phosphate uridylyltransferase
MEPLFTIEEVTAQGGVLEYRREHLTGMKSRICRERTKRGLDTAQPLQLPSADCPFCPDLVERATPTFEDGTRIVKGESVTFPNLFPFSTWHTVTVITRAHVVERVTPEQLFDALSGQLEALQRCKGYASINWNYLPSSGASMLHPHLQGLVDREPSALAERYIRSSDRYFQESGHCYWDVLKEHEKTHGRYLFGDEIYWVASAVPLADKEIRGILPISTLGDLEPYLELLADGIIRIIDFYRAQNSHAFNMSLFFDEDGRHRGFRAFCSIIARINPNACSMSDSAFMERLHHEPVILTSPEELADRFRAMSQQD